MDIVGKMIGKYVIKQKLGQGGMAEVFLGFDTNLEKDVAIKIIRTEMFPPIQLEKVLKRFEIEARALSKLNHPNIIEVIDFGTYSDKPYLVMPYLSGGTLKDKGIQKLDWRKTFELLIPIANGLFYAHEKNIIHRDLKPSNILMTDSGHAVLTDFGVAKIIAGDNESEHLTGTGFGVGTPAFMAPEQWLGSTVKASDQYGFGILLFQLITGVVPFTASTPAAVMLKQSTEAFPNPQQYVPDLPLSVKNILIKLTAREPDSRFANFKDVELAMSKVIKNEPEIDNINIFVDWPKSQYPQSNPNIPKDKASDEDRTFDSLSDHDQQNVRPQYFQDIETNRSNKNKKIFIQNMMIVGLVLSAMIISVWVLSSKTGSNSSLSSASNTPPIEKSIVHTPETVINNLGEPAPCADSLGCAVITTGETIKIGYAGPMTGDYAQFGIDMSHAMELAVKDAGQFEGFSFELLAEDDLASAEGAVSVANKLITDPTFAAMAGHAFSGSAAAAMSIFNANGIPMLSPSAANPDLTKAGTSVFNRIALTDAQLAERAGTYLYENLGKRNLAIIYDGTDYGSGLANGVKQIFEEKGGSVISYDKITPGNSDYSAMLFSISSLSPDAIFFGGYSRDAATLVDQLPLSGLKNVLFFGGDGVYGRDFLDRVGGNGEGVYSATIIPSNSPAVDAFNAAYKSTYGEDAGTLSAYTWYSYDAASALISVIKQVAIIQDGTVYIPRKQLVFAVRNLSGFQGISGVITCQADGECNASGPTFYVVKNGEWIPAE